MSAMSGTNRADKTEIRKKEDPDFFLPYIFKIIFCIKYQQPESGSSSFLHYFEFDV